MKKALSAYRRVVSAILVSGVLIASLVPWPRTDSGDHTLRISNLNQPPIEWLSQDRKVSEIPLCPPADPLVCVAFEATSVLASAAPPCISPVVRQASNSFWRAPPSS